MKFVKDTRDNSTKWVTKAEELMNDFYEIVESAVGVLNTVEEKADKIIDTATDVMDKVDEIEEKVEDITEKVKKPRKTKKKVEEKEEKIEID